jgi:hypothetical protein
MPSTFSEHAMGSAFAGVAPWVVAWFVVVDWVVELVLVVGWAALAWVAVLPKVVVAYVVVVVVVAWVVVVVVVVAVAVAVAVVQVAIAWVVETTPDPIWSGRL